MKLVQAFVCAVTLLSGGFVAKAMADACVTCGSGSSNGCQQCRLEGGKDTQEARKKCESRGCKISGTSSCSTAANVKVCAIDDSRNAHEVVAWTAVSSIN